MATPPPSPIQAALSEWTSMGGDTPAHLAFTLPMSEDEAVMEEGGAIHLPTVVPEDDNAMELDPPASVPDASHLYMNTDLVHHR